MVFYLVGLGLGSESDITVKGLEIVKKCKRVLLEPYTAILPMINAENLVSASNLEGMRRRRGRRALRWMKSDAR